MLAKTNAEIAPNKKTPGMTNVVGISPIQASDTRGGKDDDDDSDDEDGNSVTIFWKAVEEDPVSKHPSRADIRCGEDET